MDLIPLDANSYNHLFSRPGVCREWTANINPSSRESHSRRLEGCSRVGCEKKKARSGSKRRSIGPRVGSPNRLWEMRPRQLFSRNVKFTLGEVIGGGMAGSRIFFSKKTFEIYGTRFIRRSRSEQTVLKLMRQTPLRAAHTLPRRKTLPLFLWYPSQGASTA